MSACLLVVGSLAPVPYDPENDPPQLSCILIRSDLVLDDGAAFPQDAVEYGYQLCTPGSVSEHGSRLVFALHAQAEGRVLSPVVLPSLASMGLRLWKRGAIAHCISRKEEQLDGDRWNEAIKSFVESNLIVAPPQKETKSKKNRKRSRHS